MVNPPLRRPSGRPVRPQRHSGASFSREEMIGQLALNFLFFGGFLFAQCVGRRMVRDPVLRDRFPLAQPGALMPLHMVK